MFNRTSAKSTPLVLAFNNASAPDENRGLTKGGVGSTRTVALLKEGALAVGQYRLNVGVSSLRASISTQATMHGCDKAAEVSPEKYTYKRVLATLRLRRTPHACQFFLLLAAY